MFEAKCKGSMQELEFKDKCGNVPCKSWISLQRARTIHAELDFQAKVEHAWRATKKNTTKNTTHRHAQNNKKQQRPPNPRVQQRMTPQTLNPKACQTSPRSRFPSSYRAAAQLRQGRPELGTVEVGVYNGDNWAYYTFITTVYRG